MSEKNKKIVYNKVFDNEYGKEVLSDLRAFCMATRRLDEDCYPDGKLDVNKLLINVGRHSVFVEIMNTMQVDFTEYYEFNYEEL